MSESATRTSLLCSRTRSFKLPRRNLAGLLRKNSQPNQLLKEFKKIMPLRESNSTVCTRIAAQSMAALVRKSKANSRSGSLAETERPQPCSSALQAPQASPCKSRCSKASTRCCRRIQMSATGAKTNISYYRRISRSRRANTCSSPRTSSTARSA